jgi:hypothetical protein
VLDFASAQLSASESALEKETQSVHKLGHEWAHKCLFWWVYH